MGSQNTEVAPRACMSPLFVTSSPAPFTAPAQKRICCGAFACTGTLHSRISKHPDTCPTTPPSRSFAPTMHETGMPTCPSFCIPFFPLFLAFFALTQPSTGLWNWHVSEYWCTCRCAFLFLFSYLLMNATNCPLCSCAFACKLITTYMPPTMCSFYLCLLLLYPSHLAVICTCQIIYFLYSKISSVGCPLDWRWCLEVDDGIVGCQFIHKRRLDAPPFSSSSLTIQHISVALCPPLPCLSGLLLSGLLPSSLYIKKPRSSLHLWQSASPESILFAAGNYGLLIPQPCAFLHDCFVYLFAFHHYQLLFLYIAFVSLTLKKMPSSRLELATFPFTPWSTRVVCLDVRMVRMVIGGYYSAS